MKKDYNDKVKIAIISANSAEFYPPLINLLRDDRLRKTEIFCYTTYNKKIKRKKLKIQGVNFVRTSQHSSSYFFINFFERLWFVLRTLLGLILQRPDRILYIESNSAYPVYLYHRYINAKVSVLIHYYEYTSPEQFSKSSWNNYCHKKEIEYLYNIMEWYSHCNAKRMELFQNDCKLTNEKAHIVPNYPPASWQKNFKPRLILKRPIHIVYIGSLSIKNTYVREFSEYIEQQSGKMECDFFSYNCTQEVKDYFILKQFKNVHLINEGMDYDKIPILLTKYDVGVILYKGYSYNVIYCEVNKFFEYLVCGLDIWFSNKLKLLKYYESNIFLPKIISFDFENLNAIDLKKIIERNNFSFIEQKYIAEDANTDLIECLIKYN